jgi:tRNA U34 5-carboxymethylaminomethyl modifying GTPase MnmE/TrmE
LRLRARSLLLVLNKADLLTPGAQQRLGAQRAQRLQQQRRQRSRSWQAGVAPESSAAAAARRGGACLVSAATGAGMGTLLRTITAHVGALLAEAGDGGAGGGVPGGTAVVLRERHASLVREALRALERYAAEAGGGAPPRLEVAAEHLRAGEYALRALCGGDFGAEAVLDALFAEFCIGK